MKTRITISFISKTQHPYFMVIKEYINQDGVKDFAEFAEVIYKEDHFDSEIAITGDVTLRKVGSELKLYAEEIAEDSLP